MAMTHVERFRAVMAGKGFDRALLNMGCREELGRQIKEYLGADDIYAVLYDGFGVDIRFAWAPWAGDAKKDLGDGTYQNIWGVRMKTQSYGEGQGTYEETVGNPLAAATTVAEIDAHPWPDPANHDFAVPAGMMQEHPDFAFAASYAAIGWWSWDMVGFEKFLEHLILEPRLAEAIIGHVSDFCFEYYRGVIEAARGQIGRNFCYLHMADDWATQQSLLISPQMYRQYMKKHYRRIIDLAHAAGLMVEFHCCGAVRPLIPELIDTGIDILHPIQTSAAGMEPRELADEFGDQVAFDGGMDIQTILPNGTVAEVKARARYLLETLGRGGRYILAPSHVMQLGTPPENIVAMVEALYEYYGGVPNPDVSGLGAPLTCPLTEFVRKTRPGR